MTMPQQQLDTIIRFHDPARLPELERCIFSLLGQVYRPLHIILVLQRFSPEEIARLQQRLALFIEQSQGVSLTIKNWEKPTPIDARTCLLNLGLEAVQGRYLGFLDYDDALYPEAYHLLVERLQQTGDALVFASVRLLRFSVYPQFLYAREEVLSPLFSGTGLLDMFVANFCPLHSYLIDRARINQEDLYFDPQLTVAEDYDLLLRFGARYLCDFSLLGTNIGYYAFKDDCSNTLATGIQLAGATLTASTQAQDLLEQRRRNHRVAKEVCARIGITSGSKEPTIREVIERAPVAASPSKINYRSLLTEMTVRGGVQAMLKKCRDVYRREKIPGLRARVRRAVNRHRLR